MPASESSPDEPITGEPTTDGAPAAAFKPLRTWIPLLLLPLMAFMRFVPGLVQNGPSMIWMASAFGPFLVGVLVVAWWLFLSRARWSERLVGVAGLGLIVALVQVLADPSMRGPPLIVMTIPLTIAAFAIGLVLLGRQLSWRRTAVALLFAMLGGGISDLLRTDGVWGDFSLGLQGRWAPTTEDKLLASRRTPPGADAAPARRADATAFEHPEWPGFRGADGDGTQHGMAFSDDWQAHPPQELWRTPVGPAWSSFAVAGTYLLTQEQRGEEEAVVCYDGETGSEVWQRGIPSRFFEALGGLGPRATPSIDGGAVYALGAEGWLVKLDASSGALVWKIDLRTAAGREPPMWGFSASPCVHEGLVIVYAGGKDDKGVLAFKAVDGSLAWSAPCGEHSYGTVQTVNILGRTVLGVLSEQGAHFYDPASGAELLAYRWPHQGYRALQPKVVDRDRLLIPTGMGTGTRLIRITEADGKLVGEEVWTSKDMKSDFNDCVVHEGYVYGFDNTIFTCIDLANGKRRWKGGRYEKGQALLLADSGLVVVVSERGELVLLRATPDRFEELATIPALAGKSWNHPVIVGDKLYLRNAQEAVCYRLERRADAAVAGGGALRRRDVGLVEAFEGP